MELYLSLGTLLEASDRSSALQLYLQFPRPDDDASATFDHATLATCAVRLLLERQDYGQRLVDSLVVVGRVLGVLNIEKHIAALDLADQVREGASFPQGASWHGSACSFLPVAAAH